MEIRDSGASGNLVLGVCGGIAAYKSADLVRRLREDGWQVRVMMTPAATEFVGPLTFQALSGHRVHLSLLDPEAEMSMGHIELARWADVCLIAPATANFIARLANGLADDLPSTVCLATSAPVIVAPAMNQGMWTAPATRANIDTLLGRDIRVWGPADGDQACGEVGPGRMLEPTELACRLRELNGPPGSLHGSRVLITAGPTREPIDPVRYISNRSSGKMGFALARAAREAGARVSLVSGPCQLATPEGVERFDVETAAEMHRAVLDQVSKTDVFIAAAAVADYSAVPESHKIKKAATEWSLRLNRTPDILAQVAGRAEAPFTVGFAAETQDLDKNALKKLRSKALDMIAANRVGVPGLGFDSDDNALTVYWMNGRLELPKADKLQLARQLVALIAERLNDNKSTDKAARPAFGS